MKPHKENKAKNYSLLMMLAWFGIIFISAKGC